MLHFRLDVAEWTNINGKNMATFNIYIDKSHTQEEEQKLILQRKEATSLCLLQNLNNLLKMQLKKS